MKLKKIIIAIIFITLIAVFFIPENKKEPEEEKEITEKRAIYISYLEYGEYLKGKSIDEQKRNIDSIVEMLFLNNFNMIILHVRPFSDAIYKSGVFPYSYTINGKETASGSLDILEYFIKASHEKNIEVHAWINPYRIRNTNNISSISKDNPAYKWIKEKSNNVEVKNGIYYNPASQEVLDLIVKGVEEIVKNYAVDGIHYDDYYYPTETIDLKNYEEYKNSGGELSLKEYRYQNIYKLLEKTNKIIKKTKSNVLFGISPAGNIENNLNNEYLNIKYILENTTYLDYVMPQIYFGFNNSNKPFIDTVKEWNNLIKNKKTKLYIALSPYKIGLEDKYAGKGKDEWIESENILARQILFSRTLSNYVGFSLFRYEFVFNEKKYQSNSEKEITNMLKIFNIE